MKKIEELIRTFHFLDATTALYIEDVVEKPYGLIDPEHLDIELASNASATVVVLRRLNQDARLNIVMGEGAKLNLVELNLSCNIQEENRRPITDVEIEQHTSSICHVMTLSMSDAEVNYKMNLNGHFVENYLHGLFLLGDKQRYSMNLLTNHNVADCKSDSKVKGVAGGEAFGRFYGLVYVAPDAQRTDSNQSSRNILLGENARIEAKPQLEIYADDVKCNHGATVGQMDDEAIYYMRQRGLSEMQARQLQIEGFASDIIQTCQIDSLSEMLMDMVREKMENI